MQALAETAADPIVWAATDPSFANRTGLVFGPGRVPADALADLPTPALRTAVANLTARSLAVALR